MNPTQSNYAGNPAGIATAASYVQAQNQLRKGGSLTDAFEELCAVVTAMEERSATLYTKTEHFLEPNVPTPVTTKEDRQGQGRSASPLAHAVFEYAARLRAVEANLADIANRISL